MRALESERCCPQFQIKDLGFVESFIGFLENFEDGNKLDFHVFVSNIKSE